MARPANAISLEPRATAPGSLRAAFAEMNDKWESLRTRLSAVEADNAELKAWRATLSGQIAQRTARRS